MAEKSLVLELQALAQEDATDLAELLRRAKVVAMKLRLDGVSAWVDHEMNGYRGDTEVPSYRKVPTYLVMKSPVWGTQPVQWSGDGALSQHFASVQLKQPIGEVVHLAAGHDDLEMTVSSGEMEALLSVSDDFRLLPAVRRVPKSGVKGILDAVRNRILEWALQLERQGILGTGMTFTKEEKESAVGVTIKENYGTVVHGHNANVAVADGSPGAIVTAATRGARAQQRIRVAINSAEQRNGEVATALKRITEAIATSEQLPPDQKDEAAEQVAFVAEQCVLPAEQRQPASILKRVLGGLRDTLGLSADVLQVWTTVAPVILAALNMI